MAPRKTEAAALVPEIDSVPSTALTAAGSNSLLATTEGADARDFRGKDNIDERDVTLPRLALAQSLTPQTKRANKAYIDGLEEGHIFNTLTEVNYGGGPIPFIVLKLLKNAAVFDEQGKVIERDVPWNDPRCEFTQDGEGKSVQPVADRCYDFIVYLPTDDSFAVLRMKRTQVKVAKRLCMFLQTRMGPSWAGLYALEAVPDQAGTLQFYNLKVQPKGATPPALYAKAEALHEMFSGRTIVVEEAVVVDDSLAANPEVPATSEY
jgi:hypothetical protein